MVPTIIEAPPNQNITVDPNSNLRSELSDSIMHEPMNPGTNSTSAPNDRAITSSHLTVPSSPPLQLQSTLNNLSSLTPEQLSLLLSFLSQLDVPSSPSIDPSLGFPSNPDNADVNQLNTFAHSPSNFGFSSLGNLSSPSLPGFTSSLNTGTGLPPLLTGTSAAETATTPTSPGLTMGPDHLLTLEPDAANAAVLPRLERHWKDVQDVDKDVLESENQIHQLIDSLGPFLLSSTGLPGLGLGPAVQMNGGSTMMPSMNEATPTMKHINMLNATSSHSTTTKMDGVDDAETDISSLDPAHLSIPTGLENTDFDFDSFFPHNSSTSTSDSTTTRTTMTNVANASLSSTAVNPLSAKPSVIDSTKDINFDMDGISGLGDINGYNDLNVGPQTMSSSFLNDGHLPAPSESPVQRSKTLSVSPTTTTNTSGIGRKRKSEVIGMEELEDALLGVAKDGSGLVVPGGETVGVKAKRRKD